MLTLLQDNPRTTVSLVVAKELNLDIELLSSRPSEKAYLELNPLGRFPTFVGSRRLCLDREYYHCNLLYLLQLPCTRAKSLT